MTAGVLEKYDVRVLGTGLEAIRTAEDRETLQGAADGDRRAGARVADRVRSLAEARALARADGAAAGGAARLHAGWHRRRALRDRERFAETVARRSRCLADQPGAGRALAGGMEGDRVRGDARRGGHVHHRLQHGEPRPDGRAHRRLDRGRASADADRPRAPAAAERGAAHHPRSASRAAATCSSRSTRTRTSTTSSRSTRASRARRRWRPRQPAIRSPGWPRRSPSAGGSTRSPTR